MSLKAVFVGPQGLRAGWRFLLFILLAMPLGILFRWLAVHALHYPVSSGIRPPDFVMSDGLGFVAVLVVLLFLARIGRERVGDYGFPLVRQAGPLWVEGVAWGVLAVGVLLGLIALFGGFSVQGLALSGGALVRTTLVWVAAMVAVGLFEESVFRGYVLVSLGRGMGFWPAALLLSAIFGGIHYFTKPMENVADALSVGLLGLFLCVSFRRTGSLWFAAGFHTAFDFMALPLLGAPNTANQGQPLDARLLDTSFHGPAWLTGGVTGMEASLLIFPVLALLFWALSRRFPEVRRPLGKEPGPARGEEGLAELEGERVELGE